ncbi:MAG: AraC family transcriptional regulator [Sphingomonas bacterium]
MATPGFIVISSGSPNRSRSMRLPARTGPAILIPAGLLHAVRPTGAPVRVIYVQSFSPLGRAWADYGREDLIVPPAALSDRLRGATDLGDSLARLSADCSPPALDGRLRGALRMLASRPVHHADIAAAGVVVGLSGPRLRALAAAQLGAPLAQWRLWFMLEAALRSLGEGQSIAGAAIPAGFSDQAHLGRTMRRLMGVTPRTVVGTMAHTDKSPLPPPP